MFNEEEGEFDELWEPEQDDQYPYCQYHCGPHCQEWGGDGLCMVEIHMQMEMKYDLRDRIWMFFYVVGNWFVRLWRKVFPEKFDIDMDDLPF